MSRATSARTIRNAILGKTGIESTLVFDGRNYFYKTEGGRYYIYITISGEHRRIEKARYDMIKEKYGRKA